MQKVIIEWYSEALIGMKLLLNSIAYMDENYSSQLKEVIKERLKFPEAHPRKSTHGGKDIEALKDFLKIINKMEIASN